jgi:Protein of unknown function (DUF2764)
MIRKYYYLAASLPELLQGGPSGGSLEEYVGFCSEVLHPDDLLALKQLFLFNDLRNAVEYRDSGSPFIGPSFYDPDQIRELSEYPDSDAPFVGRYLANRKEGLRRYPEMAPMDEALCLFYEEIDRVSDDFVRGFFLHELELRNIAAALELRANDYPLKNKLIPYGKAYEQIIASEQADWGLSDAFPYFKKLLPLWDDVDLTARETALDDIRWQWSDAAVEDDFFTLHAIAAYGTKLMSVERWAKFDETVGNALFTELLESVRRSVRFSIESSHLTEAQREERRRQLEAEGKPRESQTEGKKE